MPLSVKDEVGITHPTWGRETKMNDEGRYEGSERSDDKEDGEYPGRNDPLLNTGGTGLLGG